MVSRGRRSRSSGGQANLAESFGRHVPGWWVYIERLGSRQVLGGQITLEDNVLIGPHCSITGGNHAFNPETEDYSASHNRGPTDRFGQATVDSRVGARESGSCFSVAGSLLCGTS
ncbi:MAG: hypothetical protein GWP05_07800 [Anaerolineaceae bacterium]|nr:hypothetical protein [Anaerolineaceae bacterium]